MFAGMTSSITTLFPVNDHRTQGQELEVWELCDTSRGTKYTRRWARMQARTPSLQLRRPSSTSESTLAQPVPQRCHRSPSCAGNSSQAAEASALPLARLDVQLGAEDSRSCRRCHRPRAVTGAGSAGGVSPRAASPPPARSQPGPAQPRRWPGCWNGRPAPAAAVRGCESSKRASPIRDRSRNFGPRRCAIPANWGGRNSPVQLPAAPVLKWPRHTR